MVVCAVVLLFFLRCPAAIFLVVSFVVFDSINGVEGGWCKAHIFKKPVKVRPFIAHQTKVL